jgi:hypothetical protein
MMDVQVDGDVASALVDANGSITSHGPLAAWIHSDQLILTRINSDEDWRSRGSAA